MHEVLIMKVKQHVELGSVIEVKVNCQGHDES